jgi:hypothetical protein
MQTCTVLIADRSGLLVLVASYRSSRCTDTKRMKLNLSVFENLLKSMFSTKLHREKHGNIGAVQAPPQDLSVMQILSIGISAYYS